MCNKFNKPNPSEVHTGENLLYSVARSTLYHRGRRSGPAPPKDGGVMLDVDACLAQDLGVASRFKGPFRMRLLMSVSNTSYCTWIYNRHRLERVLDRAYAIIASQEKCYRF